VCLATFHGPKRAPLVGELSIARGVSDTPSPPRVSFTPSAFTTPRRAGSPRVVSIRSPAAALRAPPLGVSVLVTPPAAGTDCATAPSPTAAARTTPSKLKPVALAPAPQTPRDTGRGRCLWEVFVWGFGGLFLSCVCVSVSGGVVLCQCVCVRPVDLFMETAVGSASTRPGLTRRWARLKTAVGCVCMCECRREGETESVCERDRERGSGSGAPPTPRDAGR